MSYRWNSINQSTRSLSFSTSSMITGGITTSWRKRWGWCWSRRSTTISGVSMWRVERRKRTCRRKILLRISRWGRVLLCRKLGTDSSVFCWGLTVISLLGSFWEKLLELTDWVDLTLRNESEQICLFDENNKFINYYPMLHKSNTYNPYKLQCLILLYSMSSNVAESLP